MAEFETDFCNVVMSPGAHEEVVNAALENDLYVLSGKAFADTLATSVRIVEKVARGKGRRNDDPRFDRDKTTPRRTPPSGEHGH